MIDRLDYLQIDWDTGIASIPSRVGSTNHDGIGPTLTSSHSLKALELKGFIFSNSLESIDVVPFGGRMHFHMTIENRINRINQFFSLVNLPIHEKQTFPKVNKVKI